jgi:hypothetical protein
MRHGDQIVLPYAVSDTFCNFANVKIAALMAVWKADARRRPHREFAIYVHAEGAHSSR